MEEFIEKILNNVYSEKTYNKEYSKIYKLHKYWARKPWYIVDKFIEKYSKTGDTVMDPFCGSGCTGVESICNGRNFIGYDLNPTAVTISNATLQNSVDVKKLKEDFEQIKANCKEKILSLYETEDICEKCKKHLYIKHQIMGPQYKNKEILALYCPNCSGDKVVKKREILKEDRELIKKTDNINNNYWYPNNEFPKNFYKDRFSYKGISKVSDMYTKRNLYALSMILNEINKINDSNKNLLKISFSDTVLHASKLKGENVRPLGVNSYWIPDDFIEENVWFRFENRVKNLIDSKIKLKERIKEIDNKIGDYTVSKKSALALTEEEVIDYIFTDPPYGEAIQYSELSFIWNSWLNEEYEIKEEVIINPEQNKGDEDFNNLLFKALDNIYKALKQEGFFTLCFQNKNYIIWKDIVNHCKELGLVLYEIGIYDTFGNSFNKNWAKFSPKSDIYVTFKKTKEIKEKNYFYKKFDIESVIEDTISYFKEHKEIEIDTVRLYDITIAYIIWNIFYNKEKVEIENFNTKKFCKMVEKLMPKEEKEEIQNKKEMAMFISTGD